MAHLVSPALAEPIGRTRYTGLRGSISPSSTWSVAGVSGPHTLKLDCGRLGLGPMHARVDGSLALTFAKPSKEAPWVKSAPMTLDGREVIVYAESVDYGDSVQCDLFIDGVSATHGTAVSSLPDVAASAEVSSADYVSPFEATSLARRFLLMTVWLVPLFGAGAVALNGTSRSTPELAIVAALFCFLVWGVAFAGLRVLGEPGQPRAHRRLRAFAVASICFAIDLALFVAAEGWLRLR